MHIFQEYLGTNCYYARNGKGKLRWSKWSNSRPECFSSPFESMAFSFKFFKWKKHETTKQYRNIRQLSDFSRDDILKLCTYRPLLTAALHEQHGAPGTTQSAPCSPQTQSSALPSQAGPPTTQTFLLSAQHRAPPTTTGTSQPLRSRRWGSCEGRIPAASHSTEKTETCLAYEMRLRSEPPLSRLRLPVGSGPPWVRDGSATKACGGWGAERKGPRSRKASHSHRGKGTVRSGRQAAEALSSHSPTHSASQREHLPDRHLRLRTP